MKKVNMMVYPKELVYQNYRDLCQESGHILEGVFINLDCFRTELEIKS